MIVIYAEKPDMGCKFAAALGGIEHGGKTLSLKEYNEAPSSIQREIQKRRCLPVTHRGHELIVTWGAGHFGTLLEPRDLFPDTKWKDLPSPILPETFDIKLRDKANTYQFNKVKELFNDPSCEYIISATDYEREGELIFAYTYELTGTRKPYRRVHFNATTEDEIVKAFQKQIDMRGNLPATTGAKARGIADWLIGMNMTIATTTKLSNQIIHVGRVITPTLSMIVNREKEIEDFVSKPFYTPTGEFTADDGSKYTGKYVEDPFLEKDKAEAFLTTLPQDGIIKSLEKKKQKKSTPRPFDTLALQSELNKKYKMTPKESADIAQTLYQNGYITYPRVDSRYLTDDQAVTVPEAIQKMAALPEYKTFIESCPSISIPSTYFNSKKVDGHSAIVITGEIPSGLSENEQKVFDLIARSTIALAFPPVLMEKTEVITACGDAKFKTTGTIIIDPGWSVLGFSMDVKNDVPDTLSQGIHVAASYFIKEGKTTPPDRYTPGTLLKAMQTCGKTAQDAETRKILDKMKGLGRPSTRDGIISRLESCEYIEPITKKKNSITPTELGRSVIESLDLPALKSPDMSAEWEKRIDDIEQSSPDECTDLANVFIRDISNQTRDWCVQLDTLREQGKYIGGKSSETEYECPVCHLKLKNAKYSFMCSCGFKLHKEPFGHKLSDKEIGMIMKHGRTAFITGLKRKDGSKFNAYLVLEKEDDVYKLIPSRHSLLHCPLCNAPLTPFNKGNGYYCSEWKQDDSGCNFRIFQTIAGKKLGGNDLKDLLEKKETKELSFKKKDGSTFKAKLVLDQDGAVSFGGTYAR